MERHWPRTLAGRLVATLILVVVVTTALVAVVTTVAMRSYLGGQLDRQVGDTLVRARGAWEHGFPTGPRPSGQHDGDENGPDVGYARGNQAGSLTAVYTGRGSGGLSVTASGQRRTLSSSALRALNVPADGHPHTVELPALGSYRVEASVTPTGKVVAGLPTHELSDAIGQLVLWEVLLGMGAVAVAVGFGRVLVQRQLRPLRAVAATAHEVSTLPLATGEIEMSVRVPDDLTDPRTEVGQVGSAMNTMLGHVEEALDARHRSEQQVRQFVADASHELRTPLSTIHGYAELSRRASPADPEQLAAAMSKVESEATRMSSLVDDLLLLARLDAGRPLERAEVDLTRLVLEAVSDAQVVGPDHKWQLDLPDEPVSVTGDELRLHQALTNLLNNARRHTPPGTTVKVSVAEEGTRTVLRVHDDGPGLAPDLVEHAFKRFTRGDSSRTRASGGAGLGLSLVEAITTAHGGTVGVRSVPGDTTFEIRLPALHR
ncbi:MAG: sensor histidine kinase [Nocardioidaceae bacterium]